MGFWSTFSGTIVFENQVEDDIWLMEDLISRYSNIKLFTGTEISYHRQTSSRRPLYERFPDSKVNRKTDLTGVFKRQPNELLSTKIKTINLYKRSSDNISLEAYMGEIKDIIEGLNSIFPIEIANFVFINDIDFLRLTYYNGKFIE